ncbi:MAG TPA: ribulokinase [Saprospiraceae bacterium]|nr:ribulokinase [Saprospiraceae bacterium]HPG06472.1 ribulokinase [Saprospiraceae bacterium]HRV84000.1 ribulokinase [Saprospiraceae bacterium]
MPPSDDQLAPYYVIGVDFGTDSVRSLLVRIQDGEEIATSVFYYPRWKQGLYCQPGINQFRQHPLDYIEGLEFTIRDVVGVLAESERKLVRGIAIDTTGSTPVAVSRAGVPLALVDGFTENPNAMFVLWKDHTAISEADEINALCQSWAVDYTQYEGGIYSSEWFWAKILHVIRQDEAVAQAAYSWVEHCDWIPFLLTGGQDVHALKRSRCAAGHKALWHPSWQGLPEEAFLVALDSKLEGIRERLYQDTFTSEVPAGTLSGDWADRLGLGTDVVVSVGAFDAHMGAVGGQIEPYHLSKVMGTSTCDMLVAPSHEVGDHLVRGICGQVDGSVIPGMVGLEAGQSAFGDVYAWFKQVLLEPVTPIIMASPDLDEQTKHLVLQTLADQMIPELTRMAEAVPTEMTGPVALDWLNGRRTPDANQSLKGAIVGLSLGTGAGALFRALVEATCFGAKRIVDRFIDEGIPIEGIIGLGGVAKKAPFIMQTMANVLNRPIKIARSEQTCALGAAMFAATAANLYHSVPAAMERMGSGFDAIYNPEPLMVPVYEQIYRNYVLIGDQLESYFQNQKG